MEKNLFPLRSNTSTDRGRIIFPEYGLRDNIDSATGLNFGPSDKKIVTRNNLIFADSRDCIGEQSIIDTQTIFISRGGRGELSSKITSVTGLGISPIVVTISSQLDDTQLRQGDKISISGVQGNTAANGIWRIQAIAYGPPTIFSLAGSIGNGNYTGGGLMIKPSDPGYPYIKNTDSIIKGNEMVINLEKKLKVIRSISLIHAVIPRDIIPLQIYFPDFIEFTQFTDGDIPPGPTVRAATTAPISVFFGLFDGVVIDGVTLSAGDRVLVKDNADFTNGVYIVPNVFFANRADDLPSGTPANVALNYYVNVEGGTTNAGTSWIVTTAGPGAVDVSPIFFSLWGGSPISWASYIPQEPIGVNFLSVGFYSTPLQLWRSYINGSFVLPNAHTPPPLRLWNPPVGGATHQLPPYPYQTVPTYRSDTFTIPNRTGEFYIVCSGYGVYDLNDWTYRLDDTPLVATTVNRTITTLMRQLLLFAIVASQSYRDVDYVELIVNSLTTSSNSALGYFGYGNYQRFIPGFGLGMHYQPGTSDGANPTVASASSPIPFPEFRGNVWGPYNSPGDRFQKMGVRDLVQDLYLNGDLSNLFGTSIIKPHVRVEDIPSDPTFGLYFQAFIPVTFGNIQDTTNPNILNAMRVIPNGYGALNVTATGDGGTFTNIFQNAGGQGPDPEGVPVDGYDPTGGGGAWVNNEVLDAAGTGEFTDEIGAGPGFAPDGTTTMTVEAADADYTGDETGVGDSINRRIAWYDLGPCNGKLVSSLINYRSWATKEVPDTNVVMNVFQAERNNRNQSTNPNTMNAIFSCPIRLNLGTTSGTLEYVENIHAFLASSQEYWEKRFLTPLQELHKLSVRFTSYEGTEIPLERMLQPRRSLILLQQFTRVFGAQSLSQSFNNIDLSNVTLSFLFDPLDPRLVGREKRNLSLIFRVETYEYESPGLYLGMIRDMLDAERDQEDDEEPNILKASNYESYMSNLS